jgi:PAS domain S-box-containing protein
MPGTKRTTPAKNKAPRTPRSRPERSGVAASRKRTTPAVTGLHHEAERVFDALGDAVSIQDRSFRILYQNKAHQKMAGSHRGKICYSAYAHSKHICPGCPIREAFKDGRPHLLVKQPVDERGARDIEITASLLKDSGGSIIGGIEIVRDITEQRRIENALRDERNFVTTVIDTLDAMVLVLDRSGRIVRFNRACERITGYRADEVKGKNSWDLFLGKKEAGSVKEAFQNLSAAKFPNSFQSVWMTKDGGQRLISWSNSALLDGEGNVKYIIPTGIDITDHHRADEALAAEKEQLSVTLRSIGDGVITTDTACNVVLMNKVAEDLTGWSQAEAAGKSLADVFRIIGEKSRQTIKSPVEKALSQGTIEGIANHTVLVSRQGTERIIADSAAPIRDAKGVIIGAVLVFRDMTEKRIMEGELLKAQKIESLGVLAGGIAHDYNNLLTAILGNINLANALLKKGDPARAQGRLTDAERASMRARDLTRQLLTFAKGGAPVKNIASLSDLIRESASFALRGSPVRCDFSLPKDLWPIEADEGQISQVMHNLVINALQSLPDQGGMVSVRCANVTVPADGTQLLPEGKYVKVSVQDSGCGIPPEHLPKIFDPYFTTKKKGVGLGLATSYSAVRRHNGLITVESTPGAGTTFHVYLPAFLGEAPTAGEHSDEGFEGSGRVLVMDDEELVRTASAEMLRSLGYTVEVARDGAEAVQRYQYARMEGKPFDVVIMDATVPGGMGGKDAVKVLLKVDPHARAVLSTGYANDSMLASLQELGFADVILKPYTAQDVGKVVRRVKRAQKENADKDAR